MQTLAEKAAYARKWRAKNKSKHAKNKRNQYTKNKEKYLAAHKQWRIKNPTKDNEYTKNIRFKFREWVDEIKSSNGCSVCGERRALCLDWHHVDPKTKLFCIGHGRSKSRESVKAEMEKCILLCANCHRVLHWNIKK
jgi:sRNA-binding protein